MRDIHPGAMFESNYKKGWLWIILSVGEEMMIAAIWNPNLHEWILAEVARRDFSDKEIKPFEGDTPPYKAMRSILRQPSERF